MFSSKASGVVLALVSIARATITITDHTLKVNSSEQSTVKWTSSDPDQDPESFTVELTNAIFNRQFALANNVATSSGQTSFVMPQVLAGDGYNLELVANGNINDVIAQTGQFSIGGSVPIASTPGGSTSAASTTSTSGTSTGTGSGTSTGRPSTSGLSTISQSASSTAATSTAPASAGTSGLSTGSGTSTSAAPATSTSNASAAGLVPAGSFAAFIATVVALLF